MIYAFDRCFFIKNSDEKSAKKVLGERLYTNKRIKLDFSYDIVEENDDFVTRNIIDDYCKASKEIDDYEFCELMYKDYSAKPYNINISELPAIDKESEEYQNYIETTKQYINKMSRDIEELDNTISVKKRVRKDGEEHDGKGTSGEEDL